MSMRQILSRFKNKLQKQFLINSGIASEFKTDIDLPFSWKGNNYGGFYTTDINLNSNAVVCSFGVGEDISFDQDLHAKFNCTFHLFDPTPRSIAFINDQHLPTGFNFHPYGIAKETGMVDFYMPANPSHVSGSIVGHANVNEQSKISVQMRSWQDICHNLGIKEIQLLKMDIEGAEYDVIPTLLKSEVVIEQLVIEFHSRYLENGTALTKKAIELLRKNQFKLFAVSDTLEEVSFIQSRVLSKYLTS
jgi:FkbM family methyltransferase